jgi:2,5-diketo-D-gluconate reductase B
MKDFECMRAIALLELLNDSNVFVPAPAGKGAASRQPLPHVAVMGSKAEPAVSAILTIGSARIPLVGLGTWDLRGRTCARMVADALRLGYRHIDTAEMYDNEREVGEGLRAAGIKRDDVFVTTKIWPSHFAPRDLDRSARQSLSRLGLDAVDLLLLHWPNPQIPLRDTLDALRKVKRMGLARHIGVSNFTVALIEQTVALAQEQIACNQIEMHPLLDQSKVLAACRARDIAIVAYSPIARGGAAKNAVLARIGKPHGKTAAQVSLRFLVQQGIAVIPRTSRSERLAENLAIFDFELTPAEMGEIGSLASRAGRVVDFSYSGSPNWD